MLMVHQLSEKINCDHLFNIFSLYGNVYKVHPDFRQCLPGFNASQIKFLPGKPVAMIQMDNAMSAAYGLECLNQKDLFGSVVSITSECLQGHRT